MVREYRIAPAGALARVKAGINKRPRRFLGILKTQDEFVGTVDEHDGRFEVWERRSDAVHVMGRMRRRHRGTRVEMRFVLATRTRVLLPLFGVLYAIAAYGFTTRAAGLTPSALVWVGGAALVATIFVVSALRQRATLRAFVEGLFRDLEDTADT